MMKRNSSLLSSNEEKRHARWGHRRGWAQGDSGYSLLPQLESPKERNSVPLSTYKNELFLEKQLQPSDTLQSLALEFNCSIAELKRVNRILKDNEIFALRVVKIPARCYSLLTERLPSVHTSACTSESPQSTPQDMSIDLHAPVAPPRDLQAAGDATSMVGLMDGSTQEEGVEPPYETDIVEPRATCNGADWGLSWLALLFLGVVGPLIYVIYISVKARDKT